MKCEDFMTNVNVHRPSSEIRLNENVDLERHLKTCPKCEAEYEERLHTVAVLESLPQPAPPADLAARIQKRIGREHRRSRLAFFANPFARLLLIFKFNPHPALVNCSAMIFYLMLTVFLVKLTFFSESDDPSRVMPTAKSVWRHASVVTTSWAEIREMPTSREESERAMPKEAPMWER